MNFSICFHQQSMFLFLISQAQSFFKFFLPGFLEESCHLLVPIFPNLQYLPSSDLLADLWSFEEKSQVGLQKPVFLTSRDGDEGN